MRVTLYPADHTGCGKYRLEYPAQAVQGDIEITWRGLKEGADVVVFQRPLHHFIADSIPHLQRHGVAVVVDLDDDFRSLHPAHACFAEFHPQNSPKVNWHHLKRACQLADVVTVTTPALALRYGGSRARVLPNCVPKALLDVTAPRDGRTVGWGGSTVTHIGDLAVTSGGVGQALDDTGGRFLSIGPPDGVRHELSLAVEPETTGGLPFDEYHKALARLDIGIAPLADSAFNRAKSALKLLEGSALGTAMVCSPRPDYQRLADQGIGLIATDRSRDWRRQVRRLLDDPEFRADVAERSKQLVAEHWTYERNAHRWGEVWHHAMTLRRGARKAVAA